MQLPKDTLGRKSNWCASFEDDSDVLGALWVEVASLGSKGESRCIIGPLKTENCAGRVVGESEGGLSTLSYRAPSKEEVVFLGGWGRTT